MMSEKVLFPRLDQDMDEGILAAWLVTADNQVKAGDVIAEIETAKVTTTLESPIDGIVLALLAEEGDMVPVGSVIAVIGADGEEVPDILIPVSISAAQETKEELPAGATSRTDRPSKEPIVVAPRSISLPIDRRAWTRPHSQSPKERFKLEAADLVQDPNIEFALPPAPQNLDRQGHRSPLNSVREATVRIVDASWKIPQFSAELEISSEPISRMLEETREMQLEPALSVTDVLTAAMARAISFVPEVNAWFEGDAIRYFDHVDISLMVHTDQGLYAPALRSIENATVSEIAIRRRKLVEAARTGRLTSQELEPGTISLSNLGMYKIDRFNAILFPPQVAILAVGRAQTEVPMSPMVLTLTVDHRAVDGVAAARYLGQLDELLSEPTHLIN
jgi:pyruvate dehydrogenase E2 component (dihydrolipoamide acetyltransferase)